MSKPDRIAVFMGHPSHFHMFKHMITKLEHQGVIVDILIKRKDILEELVKSNGHKYIVVRRQERTDSSKPYLIWALISMEIRVLFYLLHYRPKLMIGTYAPVISHLTKVPMIVCCEDDASVIPRFAKMSYPYATAILSPKYCDGGAWDYKITKYAGFQKLAYLHPDYFMPNRSFVDSKLRNPKKEYALMRFSGLHAHHDEHIHGVSNSIAIQLVKILSTKYDIYISSERPLCEELEPYRLNINPHDIHHWLAFASIYIGDSQSMAVESAMLGIPSIRFSDFANRIGVLNALENKYKLTTGIPANRPDVLFTTVEEFINTPNLKEIYQDRRESMLKEQIDVTQFFIEYVTDFLQNNRHKTNANAVISTHSKNVDKGQWQYILNTSNVTSFFQSPDITEFFESRNDIGTQVFSVTENNKLVGLAVALIYGEGHGIKRKMSTRAIINGGVLLSNSISSHSVHDLLDDIIKKLRKTTSYIEIRNFNNYSFVQDAIEKAGFKYQPHYNFHIDPSNFESRMSKTRRYEVRRGLKEGVAIEYNPNISDIRDLYRILQDLYRTKVKRPLFCLDFFEQLFKQSFAHFIITKYDGEVIGGTVCVGLPGQTLYEWYACGKKGYKYKYLFPSTIATYGAIKYAATHGYPIFDMMGAGAPGDGGYGVRDFKAQFGGELVEHGRYVYVCKPIIYNLGKLAVNIIKTI